MLYSKIACLGCAVFGILVFAASVFTLRELAGADRYAPYLALAGLFGVALFILGMGRILLDLAHRRDASPVVVPDPED